MSREQKLPQSERPRLEKLRDEIGYIAAELARLAEEGSPAQPDAVTASQIRTLIRARRLRAHFFPADIFEDPAWDMMLDLMAARFDGQRVSISSLCIAAAVPPTTALRWINSLCERGLFVRAADPSDGRRVYIELSDETAEMLKAYLVQRQRLMSIR